MKKIVKLWNDLHDTEKMEILEELYKIDADLIDDYFQTESWGSNNGKCDCECDNKYQNINREWEELDLMLKRVELVKELKDIPSQLPGGHSLFNDAWLIKNILKIDISDLMNPIKDEETD